MFSLIVLVCFDAANVRLRKQQKSSRSPLDGLKHSSDENKRSRYFIVFTRVE